MPTNHSLETRTPDEAFFENWEATRERGAWRFVFVNGIVGGTISGALFTFLAWLVDHVFDSKRVAFQFLGFILVCCLVAPVVWWAREARYKRIAAKRAAKA